MLFSDFNIVIVYLLRHLDSFVQIPYNLKLVFVRRNIS